MTSDVLKIDFELKRICQIYEETGAPCSLIRFGSYFNLCMQCMHRLSICPISFLYPSINFTRVLLTVLSAVFLFLYPLLGHALTLGGASTVMKRGRALPRDKKRRLKTAREKPEVKLNEHLCQLGRNRSADGPGGWTKQVGHTVGILETAS